MQKERVVFDEINKLLLKIKPVNITEVSFTADIYDGHRGYTVSYYLQGIKQPWLEEYGNELHDIVESKIIDLLENLHSSKDYKPHVPWTHIKFTNHADGSYQVEKTYVPEWDSWPGVYMRGVSNLTEEETEDIGPEKEVWQEYCERAEKYCMQQEQLIAENIGDLLWSIFPEDATEIIWYAKTYPEYEDTKIELVVNGEIVNFTGDPEAALDIGNKALQAAKNFWLIPPFNMHERWTHIKGIVNETSNLKFHLAYINQEDDIDGVFMKGSNQE